LIKLNSLATIVHARNLTMIDVFVHFHWGFLP
jgi:hypothetical protein